MNPTEGGTHDAVGGRVLLVIPSYRDAERLGVELPNLRNELSGAGLPVDILVVDDGSGTQFARETSEVVERERGKASGGGSSTVQVRPLLALPENLGKGGAVYAGWGEAGPEHDWLGFVDADGATPAREVLRLLGEVLASGSPWDGILACRIQMLGRRVERHEVRHFMGRFYATLANFATGLPVHDSQCGCKFFRRELYEQIRGELTERRFGFDMELLWEAARVGGRLREIPVDWTDVPGSKVRVLRDGARMLSSLWRLSEKVRRQAEESVAN